MAEIEGEKAGRVERRDRYTIVVDGSPIRATLGQEARIRAMDAEQRARFLRIMGRTSETSA